MKKLIETDRNLNSQTYLELMTGKYYSLNTDYKHEEVEKILVREFGEGIFWSYSLIDIPDGSICC